MASANPNTSRPCLICKITDSILLVFFLLIAICAPLFDSQACLPARIFPGFLVDMKSWYGNEFGDFLMVEKPDFFVGIVWLELLFQWPLSIANIYGIVARKSWYQKTCLMYGVSTCSGMAAILGELMGSSGKASNQLLMIYLPFMGFPFIAILRGLIPNSSKTPKKKRG
ncbi:uncharacterized protein LOC143884062 [Tasmannia lanceolata]|uniref:uncharacterized protein LOC143884062 n=1 Tax=Tasmannia lanceolata TaxID=3420 RepID=UPI004063B4C2